MFSFFISIELIIKNKGLIQAYISEIKHIPSQVFIIILLQ